MKACTRILRLGCNGFSAGLVGGLVGSDIGLVYVDRVAEPANALESSSSKLRMFREEALGARTLVQGTNTWWRLHAGDGGHRSLDCSSGK